MGQIETFLHGEGDAWFTRNAQVLTAEVVWDKDLVLQSLVQANVRPRSVLEVGAANGYRLAVLADRFGCSATALEPSASAIRDGETRFPAVRFVRGLMHDMHDLADGSFDLVLVNFVLHWIDRSKLFASVAEIDRVLVDGGHLVIGDFLPEVPQKVRYHHLPGADVWTYKQDYRQIWLSSSLYREVNGFTYHHGTRAISPSVAPDHRAGVTLLRKDLQGNYAPRVLS
jgi:ubiquinone/menaquinone biosynthesis C-methylase UbiE